ncbi:MAG: hypothetical protein JXQ91_19785 [Vannielia sp.]|uniref:hypothetical protein n=1 Tax=Rhodobacterales TaxID=204455 RepID=UPI0020954881|nr:hypothetical protein [Oceanicola sp. 502str15]MCO6381101.1 hypothetical protein [Oceanicola sp. 502str15]
MTKMMPYEVQDAFLRRGWKSGAGGDLYYNGARTTDHPHLHMRLSNIHGGPRPNVGGDIRMGVTMLAFSGGPGGGGGTTFISNNGDTVRPGWKAIAGPLAMNGSIREEFGWVMDYFVNG